MDDTPRQTPGQLAVLVEQYQSSCAAIAMLSLYELATAVRAAFPDAVLLVFGDGEDYCLEFEHAEDDGGQIVVDAEQVEAAGIAAAAICSNIGTNDIGRVTWIRYAPYQRRQNAYHCLIQPILDLPADLLTTPATTRLGEQSDELSRQHARTGELEKFVAGIAALRENDDAFDTLHDLISDARRLMLPARQHVTTNQTDHTTRQTTGEGDPPD